MRKKSVILFSFVVAFLLMINKAEAVCVNNNLGALLNGVQSYTGCINSTSLMVWSCAGQDSVTSSTTSCTTPDGRGYCSGNKCKIYECIKDSQCPSDSNPCTKLSVCNLALHTCTAETDVSDGTSCGTNKYCYSGNCKTSVGLGDSCDTNYICTDNGTYCGPAKKCICTSGLGNCADDSDTCLCRFDLGWDCKDSYDPTKGWQERCEPPSYSEPEAPSVYFSVDKASITLGESIKLSYRVGNDAEECIASAVPQATADPMSYWLGWKSFSNGVLYSSSPITPNNIGNMKYVISCSNEVGTNTKSINVTVNPVVCNPLCNDTNKCQGESYLDAVCGTPCLGNKVCCDSNYHCENFCKGEPCRNECGDINGVGTKDCTWREVTP